MRNANKPKVLGEYVVDFIKNGNILIARTVAFTEAPITAIIGIFRQRRWQWCFSYLLSLLRASIFMAKVIQMRCIKLQIMMLHGNTLMLPYLAYLSPGYSHRTIHSTLELPQS